MPVEVLRAMAHTGCYVAGARDASGMVGASAGWFAGPGDGRPAGSHLHSHITGVDRSARSRGVGFALKQHQRAWALARGVQVVSWTYDPLVRRNGWFNLTRLGAVGVAYRPEFYGAMDDSVNAGDESDRLLVEWHIGDDRVADAALGPDRPPGPSGAEVVLEDDGGRPQANESSAAAVRLAHVPADIEALRRTDPDAALAWRRALRAVMLAAFADGLQAVAVTASGAYVLARPEEMR